MNNVVTLSLFRLSLAYVFLIVVIIIVRFKKIGREKIILLSAVRMTIQLLIAGLVLVFIFDNKYMILSLIVLLVMEVFAFINIIKRSTLKVSISLKKIIAVSIFFGTIIAIFYFMLVVMNLNPFTNAKYFIPISGMLIGNSMTGISLGVNKLVQDMHDKKERINTLLMLGATPNQATKEITNNAFYSSILPTVNSMLGIGIVYLPGMMTGQILAGANPMDAIAYQIAIMLGIMGSVALTVILFIQMAIGTFFTKNMTLKE